jgi:ABC-type bacteriocin/lantibiotic exporter with double-glycine peptidase domain
MNLLVNKRRQHLIPPEVIQSSAMDCGPAALKSLLGGYGIRISYGRLREACQTDVDGSSIDTLEKVACELGLPAEQIMVPADHLLLPEASALPGIVVVRAPNGLTHFVVVWRRFGSLMQVMDPGTGRRWPTCTHFLSELYLHQLPVLATEWRQWAESQDFIGPLVARIRKLGVSETVAGSLSEEGLEDKGWRHIAALDAAARMTAAIVDSNGVKSGSQAERILRAFFERSRRDPLAKSIPDHYWSVRLAAQDVAAESQLFFRGAVLVRILPRRADQKVSSADTPGQGKGITSLFSPALRAKMIESRGESWRHLGRLMKTDGLLTPVALVGALGLAATATMAEAVLFRGLLDFGRDLRLVEQRSGALLWIAIFFIAQLCLEWNIAKGLLSIGRRMEAHLRVALMTKVPRLGDRYFRSRLISDMAERAHRVHLMRQLPTLGGRALRLIFELMLTTAGLIWLDPHIAPLALTAAFTSLAIPLAATPFVTELDLRLRSHAGALVRFYLDSFLGLVAIRCHGAERAVRREHEGLLVEWSRTGFQLQRAAVFAESVHFLVGLLLAALLLLSHFSKGGGFAGVLLLSYWALKLPYLGLDFVFVVRQYPSHRNNLVRLTEPLGATDEDKGTTCPEESQVQEKSEQVAGVGIKMCSVTVRAAGHLILDRVDLEIGAGSHLAIVGPSGAGKSSLVGLLLGWHTPASGAVLINGEDLSGGVLELLRRQTAWVDPQVQVWNRTLLENLRYGSAEDLSKISQVLSAADLIELIETLPDGLRTVLGEGGGLVSGGEGQRVRLGRAMMRSQVRLVILDEPFRGLPVIQRHELLRKARQIWRDTTLLAITHDLSETKDFDRVIVMEHGKIIQDGRPGDLMRESDSSYSAMVRAEETLQSEFSSLASWRSLYIDGGDLCERSLPCDETAWAKRSHVRWLASDHTKDQDCAPSQDASNPRS